MTGSRRLIVAWPLLAFSAVVAYGGVMARLVADWAVDDNYSHGFIIVPFALYFAWERRRQFAATPNLPNLAGLVCVLAGLLLLIVGLLGAERFATRLSMVVVLVGAVAFMRGWAAVRVMAFPLAFLLLMIPVPAILFNKIAFPLQLLASRVGETMLSAMSIPVLREGNMIVLARTTLEVAEACSGIRSLISLLTLGIIFGYFVDERSAVRVFVAASTVPIAIMANGFRVAGTGAAAHYFGDQAAQGFFHSFSGWLMFVVAFGLLFAMTHIALRIAPPTDSAGPDGRIA